MEEAHRFISSYHSHVTHLLRKVEEITGNGIVPIVEEPNLSTLMATVEQLESKSSILEDLDAKIAQSMTDPDELENKVFKAVEIQDSIAQCIHHAKRIISRSEHPQPLPPTESPLNVEATPYQPTQTTQTPPTIDVESHVINPTLVPAASHTEDTPLEHGSTVPLNPTEPAHVPGSITSQFTTRLPTLTLPTFSGNPLMWQTFWDSFSAAVHS